MHKHATTNENQWKTTNDQEKQWKTIENHENQEDHKKYAKLQKTFESNEKHGKPMKHIINSEHPENTKKKTVIFA